MIAPPNGVTQTDPLVKLFGLAPTASSQCEIVAADGWIEIVVASDSGHLIGGRDDQRSRAIAVRRQSSAVRRAAAVRRACRSASHDSR